MKISIVCLLLALLLCTAVVQAATTPKAPEIVVPVADRPVMAVVAFDDGSIQKQEWWGDKWSVGSGLADILTTVMLEKNRFRLIERSLLEKVISEQDLGAGGRVDPKTASKIGQIIGADYLIMGKVTQFSADTKSLGGLVNIGGLGGLGTSKTKSHVVIDLRIVDSTTGEILGSYSGNGEESKGSLIVGHSKIGVFAIGSSQFMETILGKATRKSTEDWTNNLCKAIDAKTLVLTPKHRPVLHPDGVVMDVAGGVVVANTGTLKGYAVGDKVEIRRKVKELKDPDTGEVVRVVSDLIGTGTITSVDEKTADISVSPSGSTTIAAGDLVKFAGP